MEYRKLKVFYLMRIFFHLTSICKMCKICSLKKLWNIGSRLCMMAHAAIGHIKNFVTASISVKKKRVGRAPFGISIKIC